MIDINKFKEREMYHEMFDVLQDIEQPVYKLEDENMMIEIEIHCLKNMDDKAIFIYEAGHEDGPYWLNQETFKTIEPYMEIE